MAKKKIRTRRKEKKNISNGVVHIQSTFNNTIVTISDVAGNVVLTTSADEMTTLFQPCAGAATIWADNSSFIA